MKYLVLLGLLPAILAADAVAGQEPSPETDTSITPELTATQSISTPEPVSSATATAPASRVLSDDGALSARLLEDRDNDQVVSTLDTGAKTLVELTALRLVDIERGLPAAHISLFTADDGSFRFTNVPQGVYTLAVWWGPGFNNVPARPTNPGLFASEITVDDAGNVTGAVPAEFSLKRKPEGLIPYPIRAGGSANIPVGEVNVGEVIGRTTRPPVRLPDTGSGDSSAPYAVAVAVGAMFAVIAGAAALAAARRPSA